MRHERTHGIAIGTVAYPPAADRQQGASYPTLGLLVVSRKQTVGSGGMMSGFNPRADPPGPNLSVCLGEEKLRLQPYIPTAIEDLPGGGSSVALLCDIGSLDRALYE